MLRLVGALAAHQAHYTLSAFQPTKMKASIIAILVVLLCATQATANLRGLYLTNKQDGSATTSTRSSSSSTNSDSSSAITNVATTELSTAMEDVDRNLRGESRKLDNCGSWHNQKCSQPGLYCNACTVNQCSSGYCCVPDSKIGCAIYVKYPGKCKPC